MPDSVDRLAHGAIFTTTKAKPNTGQATVPGRKTSSCGSFSSTVTVALGRLTLGGSLKSPVHSHSGLICTHPSGRWLMAAMHARFLSVRIN